MLYWSSFIAGLVLTLFFTPLIRKAALRWNIVDQPSPRKIHSQPIPLLGGSAIFLSFTLAVIIFWLFGFVTDVKISGYDLMAILAAGLILIVGGFLDDKYNLKPSRQIIFPILAVIISLGFGIRIQYVTNPLGGITEFSLVLGTIIAGLWLLGMIYTTKFLDGLDGLVSGVTFIGSIIIFAVSLSWDIPQSGTSVMALILAGCALGFLFYNWHPAKIFLGEGGSVFCGFILGTLAIISGSKIATALLIMGVPIIDVAWVILRRLWQGRSPVSPDRKHLHYRLLDFGLSQRQTVALLYLITGAFGLTSLFLHTKGKIIALLFLTIFMIITAAGLVVAYRLKLKKINEKNISNFSQSDDFNRLSK